MSTTKKRKLMQLLYQLTAIIIIILLLVGCGKSKTSGKVKPDEGKAEGTTQQEVKPASQQSNQTTQQNIQQDADPKQQDTTPTESNLPSTAGQSLGAYLEAKNRLVSILSDALTSNPGTELISMKFFDITMADISLLPASSFGFGQEVAAASLEVLGMKDVEYSESGSKYSVKYRNNEGNQCELQGEYDKTADALKCISIIDGKESLISENRKTSFGYISQIYTINEDGSSFVYQLAISGEDGAVGISNVSSAPPALTGNEAIDFPKQCQEWYAIKGKEVTGVTSDGKEISFEYTRPEN